MSSGTSSNSVPVRPMIPGQKSPEKKRREGPLYIDPEAGSPVREKGVPVEYHYPCKKMLNENENSKRGTKKGKYLHQHNPIPTSLTAIESSRSKSKLEDQCDVPKYAKTF